MKTILAFGRCLCLAVPAGAQTKSQERAGQREGGHPRVLEWHRYSCRRHNPLTVGAPKIAVPFFAAR